MNARPDLREVERRWRRIFSTLHGGGEVPPSLKLRTEGMMELLELQGLATPLSLQQSMARCYREETGQALEEVWGGDWKALFPFPQIPGFGQRAPVYPSTREAD